MNRVVIGVDIGTTSVKAVACTTSGEIIGTGRSRHEPWRTPEGFVEHDPASYLDGSAAAIAGALDDARRRTGASVPVASIGLTGMVPSTVFLDASGSPVGRSPIWQDMRAGDELDHLLASLGADEVRAITGMAPSPAFGGLKLRWLERHRPVDHRAVRVILDAKDHVAYRLTGVIATDETSAASSLLYDARGRCWSRRLADAIGVDVARLPRVVASHALLGPVTPDAAAAIGLPELAGVPVFAGAGDSLAAAWLLAPRPEERIAIEIAGTSSCLVVPTEGFVLDDAGALMSFPSPGGTGRYLEAAIHTTGACIAWSDRVLREADQEVASDRAAADGATGGGVEAGDMVAGMTGAPPASPLPPGADGLVFLPYLGPGERSPIWDPLARGAFVGLTLGHGPGHLRQAVREGVACAIRSNIEAIESVTGRLDQIITVGPAAADPAWQSLKADVTGRSFAASSIVEASACGAAAIAAQGVGLGGTADALRAAARRPASTVHPDAARHARYDRLYDCFERTYRGLADVFGPLAASAGESRS